MRFSKMAAQQEWMLKKQEGMTNKQDWMAEKQEWVSRLWMVLKIETLMINPATKRILRPRGVKKDPTHILRGYGQNDFLFALMDADAQFSFLTE